MRESSCVMTGGAGFIGCALSTHLVKRFDRVFALDKLHPQIHALPKRPDALHERVEFRHVDITSPSIWEDFLGETLPSLVIHLAAETGTGQSLTCASRHATENVLGTTIMLDALSRRGHVPEHIVLASSRAVYGEGVWRRPNGELFYPQQRTRQQLAERTWDFGDATHVPFSAEANIPRPTSIYGATKLAQENLLEAWAVAFGPKLTILRLQNVYGPGQSLINSYTGIVSLFARLSRDKESIQLYEDGLMLRDFVYIEDAAAALMAAIDLETPHVRRLDVGSGNKSTIRDIADFMASRYNAPRPYVSEQYRYGDVRHASCDLADTLGVLNWQPGCSLESGLEALCAWIDDEFDAGAHAPRLKNVG